MPKKSALVDEYEIVIDPTQELSQGPTNPRHADYPENEADRDHCLRTKLVNTPTTSQSIRRKMRGRTVGPVGLEPTTNGLKVRCSTN